MSKVDATIQNMLYSWVLPILLVILAYYLISKYGKTLQSRLFASFWKRFMELYHSQLREKKQRHFDSMKYQKSGDADLRNRGLLRILEIGAGGGANFEFFPPNSRLSVVEPNAFFEPTFYERQAQYPALKLEKFYVSKAEDMKEIEDNSIDVVVSTLVLCSVTDVQKVCKEVHRVLVPGGKFYYWEHVYDKPGTWLHFLHTILNPVWILWADGCHLNRNIDQIIEADGGFSKVEQERFDIELKNSLLWKMVRIHVKGVATK